MILGTLGARKDGACHPCEQDLRQERMNLMCSEQKCSCATRASDSFNCHNMVRFKLVLRGFGIDTLCVLSDHLFPEAEWQSCAGAVEGLLTTTARWLLPREAGITKHGLARRAVRPAVQPRLAAWLATSP